MTSIESKVDALNGEADTISTINNKADAITTVLGDIDTDLNAVKTSVSVDLTGQVTALNGTANGIATSVGANLMGQVASVDGRSLLQTP